ncbi:MAG: outer membrane lipoprotein carrier protein LolA [Bacteroidetes bacterium]|nr:outer membrane lipoprotein carrier protein LolA [Bacteroidota bacterium]
MIQNRSFSWVIFGFFAFATWGKVAPSQAQSASDLRSTVAQKYERLEGMAANFVQVANSEFMEGPERFSGSLLFSGPKYRIETSSQTIVTDGKTLWVYNRGEKQVIINDLNSDETSFSLTSFLRQFGAEYNTTLGPEEVRQGVKHRILNLEPKRGLSQFRSVQMSVRLSDTTITHLDIIDLNDVHMTIDLSDIKVNPKLAPESFVFVAPSGVEQIDLRN